MNMNIKSAECSWHQSEMKLFGRVIKGIRGWEIKTTRDKEHIYGAGQKPLDIVEGNVGYSGSIKILGHEIDAMNAAAKAAGYEDITELPHEAVVATVRFKKDVTSATTFMTIRGMAFTEVPDGFDQGAKNRELTLPFLAMDVDKVTI